jgi:sRNA-binding protein
MSKKDTLWNRIAAIEAILLQRYPLAFFPRGSEETKPLKIGIRGDIISSNRDLPWFEVRCFIEYYTKKTRYLNALSCKKYRVDLQGNHASEVSQSHKQHAEDEIARRDRNAKMVA